MKKTSPSSTLSRPKFLGASAATVTAFTVVPRHVLGGARHVAPSDTVNIAVNTLACASPP
jgi:hypothetical protein